MGKIAIVVMSGKDNPPRAMSGLHVAKRIYDARHENGIEDVEVFLFTEGLRVIGDTEGEMANLVHELIEAGIVVGGCRNQLNSWGLADEAKSAGIFAEFARDAFSRYAREGYTVMTF